MDLDAPHSEGSEREVPKHEPMTYQPWKLSEMKTVVNRWQTCKRDEGYWNAVYVFIWMFISMDRFTFGLGS